MQPPLLDRTDLESVLDALAAERRGLEPQGASLLTEGWENLVLRTADGWIVRFPRREEPDFAREVAVLARLRGRLPTAIPQVAWTGSHRRMMAYRALDGASFDVGGYLAAEPLRRNRLAGSLARTLIAMHGALSRTEIIELGVPEIDHRRTLAAVTAGLSRWTAASPRRQAAAAEVVERFRQRWVLSPPAEPLVLLHNDFHVFNMVLDASQTELTGLWDFSCVAVGAPSFELRYFATVPRGAGRVRRARRDLLQRIAEQYHRGTGQPLDVEAAIAARQMEHLQNAVETGDRRELEAALTR